MRNNVSITKLVRNYMKQTHSWVHIDTIVHDLGPKISVNQACRGFQTYYGEATDPLRDAAIGRRRLIKVVVNSLTRNKELLHDGETYCYADLGRIQEACSRTD